MAKKPDPARRAPEGKKQEQRPREGEAKEDTIDRDSDASFPASDPPSSTPVTGPRRHHDH